MFLARRWVLALALVSAGGTAGAAGAELLLDDPAASLAPGAVPALLGPISERGRTGWDCTPEQRARAATTSAAGLPTDD